MIRRGSGGSEEGAVEAEAAGDLVMVGIDRSELEVKLRRLGVAATRGGRSGPLVDAALMRLELALGPIFLSIGRMALLPPILLVIVR